MKILDFGLAKLVRTEAEITSDVSTAAHSTPPGQVAGTVLYMSPEQARAQTIDVRSDVFSFGVVLYELLAGKHPFRRNTVAGTLTAIVEETPPDLESLGRGIPAAVAGIVRRCLEKAREDRYASGHDVAMVLEAVLAAPSGAAALQEVEERSPYPGLSSFTEKDASVFFGREREVEGLWGRIPNRRLLAVIGPSGAGKTSFVRAGVLPARPRGVGGRRVHPRRSAPSVPWGRRWARSWPETSKPSGRLAAFDEPDTALNLRRPLAAGERRSAPGGRPVRGAAHVEPPGGPGGLRRAARPPGRRDGRARRPVAAGRFPHSPSTTRAELEAMVAEGVSAP